MNILIFTNLPNFFINSILRTCEPKLWVKTEANDGHEGEVEAGALSFVPILRRYESLGCPSFTNLQMGLQIFKWV